MPQITYDVAITVLLFLIGVPALVLQSADPEIRRVVVKRSHELGRDVVLPLLAALIIILLGVLEQAVAEPPASNLALSLSPSNPFDLKGIFALVLFFALFGVVAYSTYRITQRYGRREAVIQDLVVEIRKPLIAKASVDEHALDELIELGEQSEPGQAKEAVLQALLTLTHTVCRDEKYQGDTFERLIPRLVGVLTWNTQQAALQNFRTTAEILRVVIATKPRGPEPRQADLLKAIGALGTLGRAAIGRIHLQSEVDAVLTICVQALSLAADQYVESTTAVSQALFDIGIAAIEKEHMFVAASALDKLFWMVDTNQPAKGELVADALGLASHFWVASDASKMFAEKRLDEARSELAQKWRDALKDAQQHCLMTMQFKTADNLGKMIASSKK